MPLGLYFHYVDRARTLEAAAAYRVDEMTITGDGEPERIPRARVTPSLATVLRVPPRSGPLVHRRRRPARGAHRVAVLSHGFWLRRFGGDRRIIGHSVMLNSEPTEIVGVMPPYVRVPGRAGRSLDSPTSSRERRASAFSRMRRRPVARRRDARPRARRTHRPDRGPAAGVPRIPARPVARRRQDAVDADHAERSDVGNVARALWMLLASVGAGAADRVRERRQPVPGALRSPPARSRGPSGARRRRPRHRALLSHRKRAAFDWRAAPSACCSLGVPCACSCTSAPRRCRA